MQPKVNFWKVDVESRAICSVCGAHGWGGIEAGAAGLILCWKHTHQLRDQLARAISATTKRPYPKRKKK